MTSSRPQTPLKLILKDIRLISITADSSIPLFHIPVLKGSNQHWASSMVTRGVQSWSRRDQGPAGSNAETLLKAFVTWSRCVRLGLEVKSTGWHISRTRTEPPCLRGSTPVGPNLNVFYAAHVSVMGAQRGVWVLLDTDKTKQSLPVVGETAAEAKAPEVVSSNPRRTDRRRPRSSTASPE